MLKSRSAFYVVAVFVVGAAVVHGAITHRWSLFTPDAARTDRMHQLQVRVPNCEVTEIENDVPLKERSIATSRRYVGQEPNLYAVVSIISGVPGAVSTHTPDVCYQSSGYRMLHGPKREAVKLSDGQAATLFVADFEKKKETSVERLRVRWAWTTDGTWAAPDYARFHYMKAGELYKLYVLTPLPEADGKPADDPPAVQQFVRAALEQYSTTFRPSGGPPVVSPSHPGSRP